MSERAVGRHLCDAFHLVPAGLGSRLRRRDPRARGREGVDAVLPQSSFDLEGLAAPASASATSPCSSRSPEASAARTTRPRPTRCSTDRRARAGVAARARRARRSRRRRGSSATRTAGLLKPVFSSGSRGFRVLSASADRREQLLTNRPGVAEAMRLEDLLELLPATADRAARDGAGDRQERTIDGIADGERVCSATRRRARRCGPASRCTSRRSTTRS